MNAVFLKERDEIGLLTLTTPSSGSATKQVWDCACACGKSVTKTRADLLRAKRRNSNISCGCTRGKVNAGDTIGQLTVIEKNQSVSKYSSWVCRCSCGHRTVKRTSDLTRARKNNQRITCGCAIKSIQIGDKFGFLVVLRDAEKRTVTKKNRRDFEVFCTLCQQTTEISRGSLLRKRSETEGKYKSCGCAKKLIGHPAKKAKPFCYIKKICPKCEDDLDRSAFGLDVKRPGGLKSLCRKCNYQVKDRVNVILHTTMRKKRVRRATPVWSTYDILRKIYEVREQLTEELDVQLQVDHIIPLIHEEVCGLHVPANLQITSAAFNAAKRNVIDIEFDPMNEIIEHIEGVQIHQSVYHHLNFSD